MLEILLSPKVAQCAINLTMGCTAGSLTACRLRTFVIRYFYRTTIFSIYIFTDFTNLYFHIYYISNTLSILKKYFPKRRKAAYYRYLALPQSFIINFFSKLDLLKKCSVLKNIILRIFYSLHI